jgi:hypothetical protein
VSPRGGGWEWEVKVGSEVAITIATTAQPGVDEEITCWYVYGGRTWLHVRID